MTPTLAPSRTRTATPGTSFFHADKTLLAAGECTIVRWDVDNIKSAFVNLGEGELPVGGHGTAEICPDKSYSYGLHIVKSSGATQRYYLRVTVAGCGPAPIISHFDASATDIKLGERVTVFWDVSCAQAVFFRGSGGREPVNGHDSRQVQPTRTTTYRLIVVAKDGSEIKQDITVQVTP